MSTIHQIYCTHCTHGSSALERREGELARRMLGYSVRAGSLEGDLLRRCYRRIERYVYYHLPRDTPSDAKLRLTAADAPRRLIYLPSTGGLQIVGQVCYRQRDTEGRPGSYFAHLLFREADGSQDAWSILDALKLHGAAGWVEEDSAEIPFVLPTLDSHEALLSGERPAIDENVLDSFLNTPAGGIFDDPGGVIPRRWRDTEPTSRVELLFRSLRGLLDVGEGTRPEPLLLVVEPELAALLFYGIAGLLPPGSFRDGLSLSTYEPNPDRLPTTLAATVFHDAQATDLQAEAYRGRGFALNTFGHGSSELRHPQAAYAESILRCLLEEGREAVDSRLEHFRAAGARRTEDLEPLALVDGAVEKLFAEPHSSPPAVWKCSAMARDFARRRLADRFGAANDPRRLLAPLVGQPAHFALVELAAVGTEAVEAGSALDFLLETLPADRIAWVLKLPDVSAEIKVELLARHVGKMSRLPPGCDFLWQEVPPSGDDTPALLQRLLGRLEPSELAALYRSAAKRHGTEFLLALLAVCRNDASKHAAWTAILEEAPSSAVIALWDHLGGELFEGYPRGGEAALGRHMQAILHRLPKKPDQFQKRFELVSAARRLLAEQRDRELLDAWSDCRRAILDVGRLQLEHSSDVRRRVKSLESAARRLAEAALRAMPEWVFDDDRQGSGKMDAMGLIGSHLLEGRALLPKSVWQHEALWKKIGWRFEMGNWLSAPLRQLADGVQQKQRQRWIILCTAAAVLVAVLVIFGLARVRFQGGSPQGLRVEHAPRSTAQPVVPESRSDDPEQVPAVSPPPAPPEIEPKIEPEIEYEPIEHLSLPADAAVPPVVAETSDTATTDAAPPTQSPALAMLKGVFKIEETPASGLTAPAVAVIRPLVTGQGGRPLPDWVRRRFVLACLIVEETHEDIDRYTELSDIYFQRDTEIFDGIDRVRVLFRFDCHGAAQGEPARTVAAIGDWAEITIRPGQCYIVRLELSRAALSILKSLADSFESQGHGNRVTF